MRHDARFNLRTLGGVSAGEQWIYDGDEAVARLEDKVVEQPEQNLRYFDANLTPVNLRDLRLRPGGRPLFAGVQLFWNLANGIITSQLRAVEVSGTDSDRLALTVVTGDPGGVATSRRIVTISYDEDLGSYVYDFEAHLELHSPEVFDMAESVSFEYCDPWYNDIPGPSVQFDGMWQKHFSHLLADNPDGTVWQMPINHHATRLPCPASFKRDGLLVLGFDSGNNPAVQFVGKTADDTAMYVCPWGYDIHFTMRFDKQGLYQPICPHFQMRLCPDGHVQDMMKRAQPVPAVGIHDSLPIYERQSSFATGLHYNEPSPGSTDPFVWISAGEEGAEWCHDGGRSDDHSLKISKETSGVTEWVFTQEGEGMWTEKWVGTPVFKVSCYIKTEAVSGRGAFLALRWGNCNYPERYPYIRSQILQGTNDWTRVEVQMPGPHPLAVTAVYIILRQDGSGTSYFDDLDVQISPALDSSIISA